LTCSSSSPPSRLPARRTQAISRTSQQRVREQAQNLLREAVVEVDGRPAGLLASLDSEAPRLNYDQVFIRDFSIAGLVLLMQGETEIVRNFLLACARLQSAEQTFDCFSPGPGLMPASFRCVDDGEGGRRLDPDYGEESIARVTPVDSAFWWMIVLRAYVRSTGDEDFARREDMQRAIRLILETCLEARFELHPTLLVPDGSFMIDRRMGVYGHPLEVQALFFAALRAAHELLPPDDEHQDHVGKRVMHLAYHVRTYYWLDPNQLEALKDGGVEQYGADIANTFNVYPATVPQWTDRWADDGAGYFAGNVGPGRLDYRFFAHGNLLAVLSGLATDEQAGRVVRLFEERRGDLLGPAAPRLVYPALEDRDWQLLTGSDPKNEAWSYHNGGAWPFLLLSFTAACQRAGGEELARELVEQAGPRIAADDWPEFYEGLEGDRVGQEARRRQTWSAAGWLGASLLLEDPDLAAIFTWPADIDTEPC